MEATTFVWSDAQLFSHGAKPSRQSLSATRPQPLLNTAQLEWNSYSTPDYQSWTSLTPLLKSQSLIGWILKQETPKRKEKWSVIDILAAGIAGDLHFKLKPQARHDSYAHAVSVALPVYYLLRKEFRTYEHDNGHGVITLKRVWINKKVRLRSRYAAQRIHAEIMRHAGEFMEKYEGELVKELNERGLI